MLELWAPHLTLRIITSQQKYMSLSTRTDDQLNVAAQNKVHICLPAPSTSNCLKTAVIISNNKHSEYVLAAEDSNDWLYTTYK
jgi:hypothetical protein